MSVQNAAWLGRVEPLGDSDFDRDYWCTDATTTELSGRYNIRFNRAGWDACDAKVINVLCRSCRGPIVVRNRTEANDLIRCLDKKHGWASKRRRMQACADCQAKEADEARRAVPVATVDPRVREHELATMPYAEYLKTPEWKRKREHALRNAGFACQVCYSNRSLHVHHRTYKHRGREPLTDLTVLCAECHELFHDRMKLAEKRHRKAAA